jgi:hypothetical protein
MVTKLSLRSNILGSWFFPYIYCKKNRNDSRGCGRRGERRISGVRVRWNGWVQVVEHYPHYTPGRRSASVSCRVYTYRPRVVRALIHNFLQLSTYCCWLSTFVYR